MSQSLIYVQPRIWKSRGIKEHEEFCFDDFKDYAKRQGCNLEIGTFAYADAFNGNWRRVMKAHRRALASFNGKISVHGVFQDICIHSSDSKIAKVSKQRILANMDVARFLEAKYVIFHANFNPFVYGELYKSNWIERNYAFWSQVVNDYESTVLLENFWEPSPEIMSILLKKVNSPRLRVCLDTGHLNAFSKVSFEDWISKLDEQIPYMHFSDNSGDSDQHLQIGCGNVDWRSLTVILEKLGFAPEVALETETIKKTDESLKYLERNRFYPFNS